MKSRQRLDVVVPMLGVRRGRWIGWRARLGDWFAGIGGLLLGTNGVSNWEFECGTFGTR
jgi:hypothetical protein